MKCWDGQWNWDDLLCWNAVVPTAEVSRPGGNHYGTSGASSCPAERQDRWSGQVEHDQRDIGRLSDVLSLLFVYEDEGLCLIVLNVFLVTVFVYCTRFTTYIGASDKFWFFTDHRAYCHAAWSAVVIMMSSVCLSVCQSVTKWLNDTSYSKSVWTSLAYRKCPLGTRFCNFQPLTPTLSLQTPHPKIRNLPYLLCLTFFITWPFCLRCYKHGRVLL